MTAAADRAAELRAQADAYDDLSKLEKKAADAKAAYQDNPEDEKLKGKHRAAAQALTDAREDRRTANDPRREDGESGKDFRDRMKRESREGDGIEWEIHPGGVVKPSEATAHRLKPKNATAEPESASGGATPGEVG